MCITGYESLSVLSVQSVLEKLQTRCIIAGGGPAGMMAGYLLARAGVQVAVLEKHADFIRDFRDLAGCPPGEHLLRRCELTGFFTHQFAPSKAE